MCEASQEPRSGIWLEVTEIRVGTGDFACGEVQVKGDRERPAPVWWPVDPIKADPDLAKAQLETFKTITEQQDRKRLVLAWLAYDSGWKQLVCKAFRFQSPELGSR